MSSRVEFFHASLIAKLLRLVSATQPRSGGVPRLATFACLRLNVWREPATQTASSRTAAQSRRAELESYLDKGRGECHLRQPEIAKLVENAVQFFHGERYELRAWVVMPNH